MFSQHFQLAFGVKSELTIPEVPTKFY